jgi:uncharacterized protein (DUF1697 family)
MTSYVALLRAVNVGGTGKLPMKDLKKICERLGLINVQTYIASGNVVFKSDTPEAQIKGALESALQKSVGKPVGVIVRTALEMAAVLEANPFKDAPGNRVVAIFLDESPARDALENVAGKGTELLGLGKREIYVHYGDTMAQSKLRIPAAKAGTARNMNTISKLVELAAKL